MVLDTMVIAYALLRQAEHAEEAMEVLRRSAGRIRVPDLFRAEFTNVLWQWLWWGHLRPALAQAMLVRAEGLLTEVVPADELWELALALAAEREHPAYDAFFVAAAATGDTRVVTYDRRMRAAFPEYVLTAREYLATTC